MAIRDGRGSLVGGTWSRSGRALGSLAFGAGTEGRLAAPGGRAAPFPRQSCASALAGDEGLQAGVG